MAVGSGCPSRILADQPAEPVPTDDRPGRLDRLWAAEGRAQVERAVWPGRVVVLDELARLHLAPHAFHAEWNYTITPGSTRNL